MPMNDKDTKIIIAQPMLPWQANPAGNIHGGEIMKMMDNAAGAVAIKYSKYNCVTARVDELQFHLPVHIGNLVTCTATIAYTGNTSMEVYVEVEAEDLASGRGPQLALTAFFTMVALGADGKPAKIKPLSVEAPEDRALYEEALRRRRERENKNSV